MVQNRWAILGERPLLALAAVILICLPPLLSGLRRADATYQMEVMTLLPSQETWMRQQAGEADAWLTPSWSGRPRAKKSPMSVWMNMAAWTGVDPDTWQVAQLVWRARLLGVGFVMLTMASTFWIGRQLGGIRLGTLAASVLGSMFIVLRQGRLASYDTHLLGWATLAVAAGLWGMQPLSEHPTRLRTFAGWIACAVVAALAVLTKGPLAIALIWLPLGAAHCATPSRSARRVLPLVLALGLTALFVTPWYVHSALHMHGDLGALLTEYRAQLDPFQPPWYYLGFFALAFPWSVWLVVAFIGPFRTQTDTSRRTLLIPWLWFAVLFVTFSLAGAKHQRYILPIAPAAALMVAQIWLNPALLPFGYIRVLQRVHWALLTGISILVPLALLLQNRLVRMGWMEWPVLVTPPSSGLILLMLALVVVSRLGARAHDAYRLSAALGCVVIWMSIAGATLFPMYTNGPRGKYRHMTDCLRIVGTVGDARLGFLRTDPEASQEEPDQRLVLYARRTIPPVLPEALPELAASPRPTFVMCTRDISLRDILLGEGFRQIDAFHDGRSAKWLFGNTAGVEKARPIDKAP